MAHEHAARPDRASPWTFRLLVLVSIGFVLGAIAVAMRFPDPAEGPAPARTRIAAFAICAALVVALALIPLAVGFLERWAGRPAVLGWRLVLAGGALLAVAVVGLGVWFWAYPPLHTECFTAYHHDDGTGAFRICESGRVNVLLGITRLHQGLAGGAAALLVTAIAAARLRSRSEPPP